MQINNSPDIIGDGSGISRCVNPITELQRQNTQLLIDFFKSYTRKIRYFKTESTDPEARVRFPALPEKKVVGMERGPLSLVSTTGELLDRKVAAPL
jgi:hypothetical protein